MKLVTKLRLGATASAVATLIVLTAAVQATRLTAATTSQLGSVRHVIKTVNEMDSLVHSYILYHGERPRQQLAAVSNELAAALASAEFQPGAQRTQVEAIRESADSMQRSFAKLLSRSEDLQHYPDDPALQRSEQRLAGQILIRSRKAIADALQLEKLVLDDTSSQQQNARLVIFFSVLATTIFLTVLSARTRTSVAASLAALQRGTRAISRGELGHRIGPIGRDELGDVARSFDRMAEALQESTVSRDALRAEVEERKQAEEALRAANLRLAEEDTNKNDFLAVLSHELRNPLSPIVNGIHILEHVPPGSEHARLALAVLGRQAGQLSSLVDDLLDVTRIRRNKIQLHQERLELNEVARRAVQDSLSYFEKAGIHLELEPAPGFVHVNADRTRIAQIMGNLLQNAAKFGRRGGHTIVQVGVEGSRATIRVADDGVGIPAETLGQLFQPFTQAAQTLERSQGGLGLGLALVKGLAELHGGSISGRSDGPGRGAEFLVRLPLDDGEARAVELPHDRAMGGRRRVLIIDDNADAADSLRHVLELSKHEVAVAHDGQAGLKKAHEFRPEVVLCDVGLPGMNGYDVARALRADDAFRETLLVALSGYALPRDLERAAEAGFVRHLAKPATADKLTELLGAAGRAPPS
jgi:signal transduction histidine kinase/ActR/RegA family two-component response regulator